MNVLTVYDCSLKRIRLGEKNDGGYVIFDGMDYDVLISGGIDTTNVFENELMKKYNLQQGYAFDNSIDMLPYPNSNLVFSRLEINDKNNLANLINSHESCFVKMDIEGSEWKWLSSLNVKTMNKITQMVIELHFFFDIAQDVKRDKDALLRCYMNRMNILDRLNETHVLCNIHANNNSEEFEFNNNIIPMVVECTYLNKNVLRKIPNTLVMKNIRTIPTSLDAVNNVDKKDNNHVMNYEPFVHTNIEIVKL